MKNFLLLVISIICHAQNLFININYEKLQKSGLFTFRYFSQFFGHGINLYLILTKKFFTVL
jgi:hypothetical protein